MHAAKRPKLDKGAAGRLVQHGLSGNDEGAHNEDEVDEFIQMPLFQPPAQRPPTSRAENITTRDCCCLSLIVNASITCRHTRPC